MSAINTNTRVEFCYLIAVYTTWLLPNRDEKETGKVWFLNAWNDLMVMEMQIKIIGIKCDNSQFNQYHNATCRNAKYFAKYQGVTMLINENLTERNIMICFNYAVFVTSRLFMRVLWSTQLQSEHKFWISTQSSALLLEINECEKASVE